LRDWETPENRYAAQRVLDAIEARASLAPVSAQPDEGTMLHLSRELIAALKRLSFAAQTTGGTAGADTELQGAIAQAEKALSIGAVARAVSASEVSPVSAQQGAAVECGKCNDTGIVGFPPDQYEACPDCNDPAAKAPAAQAVAARWEARRWCKGDAEWTDWQPITAAEYERYKDDATFEVRASPASTPEAAQPIYQIKSLLHPHGWHDTDWNGYEWNKANGQDVRIVYTAAPTAGAATTSEDAPLYSTRRNAARYLWLTENLGHIRPHLNGQAVYVNWSGTRDSLSAAIDAAMRATQQEGGK
jgi:hypothetical protein